LSVKQEVSSAGPLSAHRGFLFLTVLGYESHQSYPVNTNEKVLLLICLLNCFVYKNVILWLWADVGLPPVLIFAFNAVL